MRYIVSSNWHGVNSGMCYHLCDTQTKPALALNFPETKGFTVIESGYNGAILAEKCKNLNKSLTLKPVEATL